MQTISINFIVPQGWHDVVRQIKAQLIAYLHKGTFNSRRLVDIVNIIRHRPTDFPEWHRSTTARLFTPQVFRNRKEASATSFERTRSRNCIIFFAG